MSITFIETTLGLIVIKCEYAVLIGLSPQLPMHCPSWNGHCSVSAYWLEHYYRKHSNSFRHNRRIPFRSDFKANNRAENSFKPDRNSSLCHSCIHVFGNDTFGFPGLFIGPIFVTILKSLHKSGLISVWMINLSAVPAAHHHPVNSCQILYDFNGRKAFFHKF